MIPLAIPDLSGIAVSHCGATPCLMDIKKDSWCIDAEQIEDELKRKTEVKDGVVIHKASGRRVAAIMPVYTLGNVSDMDKIGIIADTFNLPVIADAAAATGSEYKGRKCGELAVCTVFSFNGNKTVTSGGGGAVVGNDEQMMNRIKHVGYSDHTLGIEVPIEAVAMGATIIEKHFTLDRTMEGPDHKASLEPNELIAMVRGIRNIEKAIGTGDKRVTESESANKAVTRKSIIARRDIKKGEVFTDDNIAVKRPGTGISPMRWYEVIGKTALHNFEEDELIEL